MPLKSTSRTTTSSKPSGRVRHRTLEGRRLPRDRPPTHPGEMLLEEFLKPLGITQSAFSRRLGVSFPRLNKIIRGKRGVTPDTALRLEVTGVACRHPEEPMRYFDAQYSGRMPLPAHLPQALTEEGTSFLDSLGFSGVPEDGDWSLAEGEPARTQREET